MSQANYEETQAEDVLERRVNVFKAVKQRKCHLSNIWFFDSPKNNKRLTITGDVAFMHFVLLEGDPTVDRYDADPEPVYATIDGEKVQTRLDANVFYKSGHSEWWEFKRYIDAVPHRSGRAKTQLSAQAQAAAIAGVKYKIKTEQDLLHKELLFDNWLLLCSAITRCRRQPIATEIAILRNQLLIQSDIRLRTLIEMPTVDRAHMLAAVALALQTGLLETDLETSFFGPDSFLHRRAS